MENGIRKPILKPFPLSQSIEPILYCVRQKRRDISQSKNAKPTIVLVHGAFADSSSWNDVISTLLAHDYPVVAASNPLRGLKNDAAELASLLTSIERPVVIVGHSYGGMMISNAAHGNGQAGASGWKWRATHKPWLCHVLSLLPT